jgi:hypothetical protein
MRTNQEYPIRRESQVRSSSLLKRIEAYLVRTGMRPSGFGRRAVRDGMFVLDLRRGRTPRPRTEARVNAFLDRAEAELGEPPCPRRR